MSGMSGNIISRRYATALLKLAKESGIIAIARSDLEKLTRLLTERKDLLTWFADEEIPHAKRYTLLRELAGIISLHPLLVKFTEVLIHKERIRHIFHIAESFNRLADEEEGIVRGNLFTSNKEACEGARKRLEDFLGKKINKKVYLAIKEDPALIGGVILQIRDRVWDATIKRRLDEIKEHICQ